MSYLEVAMYIIQDCYGAPQCGFESYICETWEEVEQYFEDSDAVLRLHEGYAFIVGA